MKDPKLLPLRSATADKLLNKKLHLFLPANRTKKTVWQRQYEAVRTSFRCKIRVVGWYTFDARHQIRTRQKFPVLIDTFQRLSKC